MQLMAFVKFRDIAFNGFGKFNQNHHQINLIILRLEILYLMFVASLTRIIMKPT